MTDEPLWSTLFIDFPSGAANQTKSNQFYLYSPKSQSHCLNGLYSLYSEQHPLSLDPRFEWGKTSHVDGKYHFEQIANLYNNYALLITEASTGVW